MVPGGGRARPSLFRVRIIHGEPYEVGGHTLIPVARVVSMGKARGNVGTSQISGWAGGFARIVPVAILARTEEGDRRIAVVDATRNLVGVLVAVGLISTLILAIVRRIARRYC